MPQARFEVGLEPAAPSDDLPCGPNGAETAVFGFSANAGEPLRPLRKVASGGELSRVQLAIRGALRGDARGMVLVFDEVDAGIGGRTADRVGRALARLAVHHQVLCITHLPQIAAFANVHFRVEKQVRAGRTRATIHRVEGDARVDEIARMAGGEKVGEATRKHARALLSERAAPDS
jgi:DNA repair protein RecN (Recombination protein N)